MQSFAGVQASYRAALQLSHAQTVTRLYRRSLRLADSWHPHRGAFLDVAAGLRARFDAARALVASGVVSFDTTPVIAG